MVTGKFRSPSIQSFARTKDEINKIAMIYNNVQSFVVSVSNDPVADEVAPVADEVALCYSL